MSSVPAAVEGEGSPVVEDAVYRHGFSKYAPNDPAGKQDHPVVAERRKVREAPNPHFRRVAGIWSQVLGVTVTPEQVVMCMIGLKLAREAGSRDPGQEPDNMLDIAGYASLYPEVL